MDGQRDEQHDDAGDRGDPVTSGDRPRPTGWRVGSWGPLRRIGLIVAVLAVALAGAVLGVLAGGQVDTDIGPFRANLSISPARDGGTTVDIPPLGALLLDSHDGPTHLTVRLGALDQRRTEALLDDPASISRASQSAVEDVRSGVMRLGLQTLGASVLVTLILAGLIFRNVRRTAWAGGLALLVTAGSLGTAAATLRPQAIEEPRYEGLLVNAPAIVGDARRIANDYTKYAEQLQRLVGNVSQLYTTVSALPVYEPAPGTTRVLHVSDMHLNPTGWQLIRTVVEQFGIDVVVDTGDITDWGSEPEASFVGSIGLLKKPYVFIRGNHDSGRTAAAVARQPNAIVLNNSTTTVAGLTIAGIGDPRFTPDKNTSRRQRADPAGRRPGDRSRQPARRDGPQLAAAGHHRSGARPGVGRTARRHLPTGVGRAHPRPADLQAAAGAGAAAHHADGGGLHRRRRAARPGGREADPAVDERALLRPAEDAPGVRRHHRGRHRAGPGQPGTARGGEPHCRSAPSGTPTTPTPTPTG